MADIPAERQDQPVAVSDHELALPVDSVFGAVQNVGTGLTIRTTGYLETENVPVLLGCPHDVRHSELRDSCDEADGRWDLAHSIIFPECRLTDPSSPARARTPRCVALRTLPGRVRVQ